MDQQMRNSNGRGAEQRRLIRHGRFLLRHQGQQWQQPADRANPNQRREQPHLYIHRQNEHASADGRGDEHQGKRKGYARLGFRRLTELKDMSPSDVLLGLGATGQGLTEVLEKVDMGEDFVLLFLNVLAKASQSRSLPENQIRLFVMLDNSLFFSETLPKYLMQMTNEVSRRKQENFGMFLKSLFILLKQFCTSLPHSITGMSPLISILEFVIRELRNNTNVIDESILNLLEELNLCKIDAFRKFQKASIKRKSALWFENEDPPDNFRNLSIFPSTEEIHKTEKPFLRANKAKGSYDDLEHYLDVQFRLLREDFNGPLREGILQYKTEMITIGKVGKIQDLRIYDGVRIVCPICTHTGLCYRLSFSTSRLKKVKWQCNKRLLYGSLICLSADNFNTLYFAMVMNRDIKELENGYVVVRFEHDLQQISEIKLETRFVMVETSAYFEAYRHILEGMQNVELNALPFQEYIVYGKETVQPPAYLQRSRSKIFDLSSLASDCHLCIDAKSGSVKVKPKENKKLSDAIDVDILNRENWPSAHLLNLDKSQLAAVQNALTKEFAITQGPPGTGKTYIGLKIVKALLHNLHVWHNDPNSGEQSPMLIVCYTNHALDQFLEGIISFIDGKIIRVGGRSSCKSLKPYLLHSAKNEARRNRIFSLNLIRIKRETREDMVNLEKVICKAGHQITLTENNILHEDALRKYLGKFYCWILEGFCCRFHEHTESALLEWLGYGQFITDGGVQEHNQDGNNEAANENESDDENINVIGEIDRLQEDRKILETGSDEDVELLFADIQIDKTVEKVALNLNDFKKKSRQHSSDTEERWEITKEERKRKRKQLERELKSNYIMEEDRVSKISKHQIWAMSMEDRWSLYRYWVMLYCKDLKQKIQNHEIEYNTVSRKYQEILLQEDKEILKKALVIGMTTTGAARYRPILQEIKPRIIIVEEAAEVLEGHIITTLNTSCEHLILIGDHQQLRPNPNVYNLAKNYNLEISLFERMISNGQKCECLEFQHRMRPEISQLMLPIYPKLKDHESVKSYENIMGVMSNMYFVTHSVDELHDDDDKSYCNQHEAEFIVALCRYLLKQGYEREQITVLTTYSGQLYKLKELMPKSEFEGVHVTVVDNYQGEENDIILLSLVRSNANGNIGFLKIDNRVCVALSRAKKGFFAIGNFHILAQQSKLWQEIVIHLKHENLIGKSLGLFCQNHPQQKINVQTSVDFKEAPEGGCLRQCDTRLKCGHVCVLACHPYDKDHKEYRCQKQCTKILCSQNHRCTELCFKDCGNCSVSVLKIMPRCGHECLVPCYVNVRDFSCTNPCSEKLPCGHVCENLCGEMCETKCTQKVKRYWPCGHTTLVSCSDSVNEESKCDYECKKFLDCGHACKGTCTSCLNGRLHHPCRNGCKKILVCGHECKSTQCSDCPPCSMQCENQCVHSKCKKVCGACCVQCVEPCDWVCIHEQCSKLCCEPCDRKRCNEPCLKYLDCGHPCIGLCGEKCPSLCRFCNEDVLQDLFFGRENDPDARFVQLVDCNHVIEVTGLDYWMDMKNDLAEIQMKTCPKCKTPIRRNLRYGNVIKQTLLDIEKVKEKIGGDSLEISRLKKEIRQNVFKLPAKYKMFLKSQNEKIVEEITLSVPFLKSVLMQTCMIYQLLNIESEFCDLQVDIHMHTEITQDIYSVLSWLKNKLESMTNQEMVELQLEVQRLGDLSELLKIQNSLSGYDTTLSTRALLSIEKAKSLLSNKEPYKPKKKDAVEEILKNLKIQMPKCGIPDKERKEIVDAMGMAKGHWFKCPNEHIYAIGDCGGATSEGTCPECQSKIGGQNHALRSDNHFAPDMDDSEYPAWSETANLRNYALI